MEIERLDLINEFFDDIDGLDIGFIYYSEPGAMGVAGEIAIYIYLDGGVTCCRGNYVYGDIDSEKMIKCFPFLTLSEAGNNGWHHVYGGCGHHLLVSKRYTSSFLKEARNMEADYIMGNLEDIVLKLA